MARMEKFDEGKSKRVNSEGIVRRGLDIYINADGRYRSRSVLFWKFAWGWINTRSVGVPVGLLRMETFVNFRC